MSEKKKNKKIRIMVVDDHPIIHEGLEQLLNREEDMEVCGFAQSVNEAVRKIEKIKPDFVIVDISLKGGVSGLELIRAIKERYSKIKTLVLSMHDENLYAERAVRAGANGYLMKEELRGTIVNAIRRISGGKLYISDSLALKFLDNYLFETSGGSGLNLDKLSDRELEVFRLTGQGHKTGEIARMLNVSDKTVGTHKSRIQEKLNLKDSADLMRTAIEWSRENEK